MAQSGANPAKARSEEVEELTITARKREENLQETPVAVTAFSATDLVDRDVRKIQEIGTVVPNLQFDSAVGSANAGRVYLRGVGNGDPISSDDAGVGIYIDGVFLPRAQGALLTLSDLERVEVLRGPQGTLFGKNTIGGAINIITAKPDLAQFGGHAEVRVGNFDRFDTRLSMNVPIVAERAAARFSFASATRDPVFRNTSTGSDVQDDKLLAGRAQFLLAPTDSFRIDLSADHSIENRKPQGGKCFVENTRLANEDPATALDDGIIQSAPSARAFGAVVGIPLQEQQAFFTANRNNFFDKCREVGSLDGRKGTSEMSFARDNLKTIGTNATLTWDVSDGTTIKSISSWRRGLVDTRADLDFTDLVLVQPQFGAGKQTLDTISQELQLTGSALGDRLNYVVGIYGFIEKNRSQGPGGIATADPLFFTANSAFQGGTFLQAFLADQNAIRAAFPNGQDFTLQTANGPVPAFAVPGAETLGTLNVDNMSYAAYTQGTYRIDDKLSLTLGVRSTYERKEVQNEIRAISPGVIGRNIRREGELDFGFHDSTRFSNVSPMANVSYQATDDLLLYTNYSKGFKSGGFNGRANAEALTAPIEDESVTAYEIGFKSAWFDRRMVLNVAAFYNIYEDIQLTVPAGGAAQAQILVVNAGKAEIKGGEIETRMRLLPGLDVSAGIGILRAGYSQFSDPTNLFAVDRRPLAVPNYTMNFAAEYAFPTFSFGDLRLRAEWTHRGKSGTDVVDSPLLRRGKNGEFSAQLALALPDGRTELALYGKNLFDREFFTNGVSLGGSFGHAYRFYNDPRQYGLELRRKF